MTVPSDQPDPPDRFAVDDDGSRRGPGRPRKWVDNAGRMRAYRRRQRLDAAKLRNGDGRRELVDQLTAVTAERDQLTVELAVLRRRVEDLETQLRARQPPRSLTPQPPPRSTSQPVTQPGGVDGPRLSRAQRRQLERDQRRRR